MPEISRFLGILIAVYYRDHAPPHFHVRYAEHRPSALIPTVQMTAPWDVTDVIPLPGYRLAIRFNDGATGLVDLSVRVASPKAGVFKQLQDESLFARIYIDHGAVTWPGEIDLAPDAMHSEIVTKGEWKLT